MLVAGVRRVPPGNGMPQPLGGGSLYNEPSTPHLEPSDHRHRPWLSMFPPVSSESSPRPANAVAPTNFTATTISHHYNAITTITTGAVIAVTAITTITTITIIAITTTITTTTPLLPLCFCN
ncbi:hypothetical protein E4U60_001598 [Claviceps pazoutovae]|uniref:Uncharacterized protein n=1 Tax=Claviceps pazoutovae TaxID=1649127 RepID=A0A9P7MCE8_9HYPO|nr:hypothetical protein E4U60_001598 [Claviceps pazoutovae]